MARKILTAVFLLLSLGIIMALTPLVSPAQEAPAQPASGTTTSVEKAASKPNGDDILYKVRDNQYSETNDAVIQMTLIDKNGIEQVKRFRIQRQMNNVLIRFMDPPDIKDTGYLILEDEKGETLIYVYFPPPTDDYRQINVEDEDGGGQSFLGSDFDITDFQIRNPEETINTYSETKVIKTGKDKPDIEYHVVKSIPKDENYKYGKVVTWVRTDYWIPIRIQFYDRKGEKVKDMKVRSFRSVGERKVASKSVMENLANDHKTILELEEIQFDITFPDDNFTIRRLTNP